MYILYIIDSEHVTGEVNYFEHASTAPHDGLLNATMGLVT